MANSRKRQILARVLVLATICAAPFVLYARYMAWQTDHLREVVGREVEVAQAVHVGTESYLREGCGVAVFQLAPAVRAAIRAKGSAAFDGNTGPFVGAWLPTPYEVIGDGLTSADSWMVGLGCGGLDPELAKRIDDALRLPGAFVKRMNEAALIVIPAAGLAVYVYYG